MAKTYTTLAHSLDMSHENFKTKDWFASRKYNGLGAFWDGGISLGKPASNFPWYHRGGDKKVPICTGLWSMGRANGKKVRHCPSSFIECLPRGVPLQGELWYDDNLQLVNSVCKEKTPDYGLWDIIKFVAYNVKPYSLWELPDENETFLKNSPFYLNEPWIQRMARFLSHSEVGNKGNKHLLIPDFIEILSTSIEDKIENVKRLIENAKEQNWEGLVLQNPQGFYECKRSYDLLKWLPYYDGTATVLDVDMGKTGKNIKRWGSIIAEMKWGDEVTSVHGGSEKFIGKTVQFHIGGLKDSENEEASLIYPTGAKLEFTYKNLSQYGVPQSANIKRSADG